MNSTLTSIAELRKQFPILNREVRGKQLVYLDNAATTQKPQRVIDALVNYYTQWNANIHRGAHFLANGATEMYEETRSAVADMLNAGAREEVIFTQGTTDGINLVAYILRGEINPGDEIWVTEMEHHANFVPWQQLALQTGATFVVVPLLPSGEWDWNFIETNLSSKAKVVAFNWVSNALGTVNKAVEFSRLAKSKGAYVLIDGAQAVAHFNVDVQELGCDFFVFSGHKMYGPTGMGVLWGKAEVLNALPPYRTGGEMIQRVSKEVTTFNVLPFKYEAGTPNIEAVVGFREAIAFCKEVGREVMHAHEEALAQYAIAELEKIEGVVIYAKDVERVGVVSFNVKGIHGSDIGTLLDQQGVAVRTGHHCTQPLWDALGELGSVRVSVAVYNTAEEIDLFIAALKKSLSLLR